MRSRTWSSACARRVHSAAGSATACWGMTGPWAWRWRAGPWASPGAAHRPARLAPGVPSGRRSGTAPPAAAAGTPRAGPSSSGPSPNRSWARARMASRAGPAWAPRASTAMVCPRDRPSMAMALMLVAGAGPRPAVRLRTWINVSGKPAAVRTSRAAGRACRPRRLATTSSSTWAGPGGGVRAAAGGSPEGWHPAWRCAALAASAPPASASTRARSAPRRACTAAATAPSTRGAPHSATRLRRSPGSKSRAISALSTALPMSMSTTTPSGLSTWRMASATRAGSVPRGRPGSASPPAAASRTSGPAISRASSSTPSASAALWETRTRPITGDLRGQACPPQARAAVRNSMPEEVAPGSWCPALRGPR